MKITFQLGIKPIIFDILFTPVNMDVPILRTLTLKSKLTFGKYDNLTIQEIINLGHTSYLRWVYFNINGITFIDEILEMIHISCEFKIDKPGTNPESYEKINTAIHEWMGGITRIRMFNSVKRQQKRERVHNRIVDNIKFSKSNLMAKNHGH
jgi:hypothetical protein